MKVRTGLHEGESTDERIRQFMRCASGECETCNGPGARFLALLTKKTIVGEPASFLGGQAAAAADGPSDEDGKPRT